MCSTEIRTDETMRSTISYGTPEHPICCITDDLGKLESQSTRWHWHDELEFSLVTRGRVTFYAEAQQFALEAGDALYISSGTIHHVEGAAGCVVENLIFSPSYLGNGMSPVLQKYVEPVLHRGPSMLPLQQSDRTSAPIIAWLKEVLRIWAQKQPLWELSILSGVLELWKAFYPQAAPYFKLSQNKQHELTRIRLQTMMAYIAQHYAELIPLEQIADAAHISPSEALRCFQSGLQTTPVQYLIDYRLSAAQHRLLASSDSVTRIAADCGFHATGYFCRMFRKKYGMTPVEFRNKQRTP